MLLGTKSTSEVVTIRTRILQPRMGERLCVSVLLKEPKAIDSKQTLDSAMPEGFKSVEIESAAEERVSPQEQTFSNLDSNEMECQTTSPGTHRTKESNRTGSQKGPTLLLHFGDPGVHFPLFVPRKR